MLAWLALSAVVTAPPLAAPGPDGSLAVDGKPLGQASAELRAAAAARLQIPSSSQWKEVASQIDLLGEHGVRSIGLQMDDSDEATWLKLAASGEPVIVVDRSAHLVHGGHSDPMVWQLSSPGGRRTASAALDQGG